MRSQWIRALLVATTLLVLSVARTPVFGHGHGRVAYLDPEETVLGIPTSYLLPTTYIEPTSYLASTSYVVPTVYATTYASPVSSLAATAYIVPTTYRTTGLFASRRLVARPIYTTTSNYYVATAYYPTTAYYATTAYYPTISSYPTVLDYPIVATSASSCCGTVAVSASPCDAVASGPATVTAAPSSPVPAAPSRHPTDANAPSNAAPAERRASVVESEPAYNPQNSVRSSDVRTAPEPAPPITPSPMDTGIASPPAAPPAEREPAPAPAPPPSRASTPAPAQLHPAPNKQENAATAPAEPNPPLAPTAEDDSLTLPPPVSPETIQREARRPVLPSRALTGVTPHILSGKVVSSNTGEGEEGVQVIISDRLQMSADRTALTDAFGRYAVRLPDGDWTVKVTMPSGRTYAVSEITVSGERIVDSLGRNVPSLTITR